MHACGYLCAIHRFILILYVCSWKWVDARGWQSRAVRSDLSGLDEVAKLPEELLLIFKIFYMKNIPLGVVNKSTILWDLYFSRISEMSVLLLR